MRKPPNILAHTAPPGSQNLRILENNRGRSIAPEFYFDITGDITGDTLKIRGYETGSGNRLIKLPFWPVSGLRTTDGERLSTGFQTLHELADWTIDINVTTVNLTTRIGGLIDGTSLAASSDYLMWAAMDPNHSNNAKFRGIFFTQRPQTTSASTTSGGGLGAAGSTFTVIAGHGNKFTVGSRIVIKEGDAIGDDFNQGVITAVTSTLLTVDLDATYGAISETNTTLVGLSGLEIVQLDSFEPYLQSTSEHSVFPGSGVEHAFCYLGSFQTDSASKIKYVRRRGERVKFVANIVNSIGNNLSVPATTLCLARWLPFNTNEVKVQIFIEVFAGNGNVFVLVKTDADSPEDQIISDDSFNDNRIVEQDSIVPRMRDCSMLFQTVVTGGTPPFSYNFGISIFGHTGDQSW